VRGSVRVNPVWREKERERDGGVGGGRGGAERERGIDVWVEWARPHYSYLTRGAFARQGYERTGDAVN